jgi:hypothetical protein
VRFRQANGFVILVAMAVVSMAAGACGSDDPTSPSGNGNGDDPAGSFTISASGDVAGSFTGEAVFAVVPSDDAESGEAFGVLLGDQEAGGENFGLNVFLDGERPATGTYPIAEAASDPQITAAAGAAQLSYSDGSGAPSSTAIGPAISGQVEITSSTATEVSGSLTLQLSLTLGDGSSGSATVSGDFTAVGGTVVPPSF